MWLWTIRLCYPILEITGFSSEAFRPSITIVVTVATREIVSAVISIVWPVDSSVAGPMSMEIEADSSTDSIFFVILAESWMIIGARFLSTAVLGIPEVKFAEFGVFISA